MSKVNINHQISSLVIDHIVATGSVGQTGRGSDPDLDVVPSRLLANLRDLDADSILDLKSSVYGHGLFLHIELDYERIARSIETYRNRKVNDRYRRHLIDRALSLGASNALMHKLFGVNSGECAARRRELRLDTAAYIGRTPKLSDEEYERLCELYVTYRSEYPSAFRNSGNVDIRGLFNSDAKAESEEAPKELKIRGLGLDELVYLSENSGISIARIHRYFK